MKKRVLILSGSPRHGNSERLCREFMRGAEEAGHDVSLVRVADKGSRRASAVIIAPSMRDVASMMTT